MNRERNYKNYMYRDYKVTTPSNFSLSLRHCSMKCIGSCIACLLSLLPKGTLVALGVVGVCDTPRGLRTGLRAACSMLESLSAAACSRYSSLCSARVVGSADNGTWDDTPVAPEGVAEELAEEEEAGVAGAGDLCSPKSFSYAIPNLVLLGVVVTPLSASFLSCPLNLARLWALSVAAPAGP